MASKLKATKTKKVLKENEQVNDKNGKVTWARPKRDGYYTTKRDKLNKKQWETDLIGSDDIDDWFIGYSEMLEIIKQYKK